MIPLLQAINLSKEYKDPMSGQPIKALDQVNFTIYPQEIVGIIGESGCGKTTLLRHIVALEEGDQGHIEFEGRKIEDWLNQGRQEFRQKVQMIFQNPYEVFDRRQTVKEILLQALTIHKIASNRRQRLEIIEQALESVGIAPALDYLDRHPHELSGGQLQRISILRSLLLKPKLIVADEPVSMLDVSIRADILDLLYQATIQAQNTMVIVSHDILTLANIAQRLFVMYQGQIVEVIASNQIFNAAEHPYTQVLISNALGEEVLTEEIQSLSQDFEVESQKYGGQALVEINAGHFVNYQKNIH